MHFFRILFFHWLTQKWFRSIFISILVCWVLYFRKFFLSMFDEKSFIFWMLLFIVIFTREVLKELFKGTEYVAEATESILNSDSNKPLKLDLVGFGAVGSNEIIYNFNWKFEKKLRSIPLVNWIDPSFLESEIMLRDFKLEIKEVTNDYVKFKIILIFLVNIPSNTSPKGNLKNFIIKADSNVFESNTVRFKILYFFAHSLPESKWGFLC